MIVDTVMLVMEIKPGLHRTGTLDVDSTRRELDHAGYFTFVMPSGIGDGTAFFDAVRTTFPLDPPVVGSGSWDALSDSLFEGLHTHPARRIAILWPDTGVMANSASSDFDIALDVLAHIASALADPRMTCDRPTQVAVLVEVGFAQGWL